MYPFLGEISLTPITTALTGLETAILAVVGAIIAGGLSLMAIKFGARWCVKLWKSVTG